MIHSTAPAQESTAAADIAAAPEDGQELLFEISARRKEESAWSTIAQLRYEDDAKATLWAIVFTGQYAAVTVRRAGATALIAEWPAGLSSLH